MLSGSGDPGRVQGFKSTRPSDPKPRPTNFFHRGVVLKVLVKKGPLGIHFLKKDPNQTGNLRYGHLGDRYFEQLPYGTCLVLFEP